MQTTSDYHRDKLSSLVLLRDALSVQEITDVLERWLAAVGPDAIVEYELDDRKISARKLPQRLATCTQVLGLDAWIDASGSGLDV